MISKMKINLILSLCMLSLISIGFSSWFISEDGSLPPFTEGSFETDDISSIDYKGSVYVVKNSENGFDFFIYNDLEYYTQTSFSLLIKIRPDLLKQNFSGQEISIMFGLKYSYTTSANLDIFSPTNTDLIKPKYAICKLKQSANRYIHSNILKYSADISGNRTYYSLTTDLLLYSDSQPSLYSISKDFQKNSEYLDVIISFDFQYNGQINTRFKNVPFSFVTNLPEEI